jgi:hypothetical protein
MNKKLIQENLYKSWHLHHDHLITPHSWCRVTEAPLQVYSHEPQLPPPPAPSQRLPIPLRTDGLTAVLILAPLATVAKSQSRMSPAEGQEPLPPPTSKHRVETTLSASV